MSNSLIARTIVAQLGNNKFIMMTGSHSFASGDDSVRFRVGRNSKAINFCSIRLNGRDLYDIKYGFVRSGKLNIKATSTDVYADQLRADFTRNTGLETSL